MVEGGHQVRKAPNPPTHWQDQAITWTNIDWSLVKSSDSHIRAISKEMPQPSITKIGLKITYIKFHSNFPGANELKSESHSEAPFNLFQAPLTTCTGSLLWSTPLQNSCLTLWMQELYCQ